MLRMRAQSAAEVLFVMAGLVPAIHVGKSLDPLTWMPATSAGMTPK